MEKNKFVNFFRLMFFVVLFSTKSFSQAGVTFPTPTQVALWENSNGSGANFYPYSAIKADIVAGLSGGTVTSVSATVPVGFSVTVSNPTTTPQIAISTTLNGIVKGNGTGFVTAIATDFPVLNQSTTGNAATVTTNANLTGDVTSVGNATTISPSSVTSAKLAAASVDLTSNKVTGILGVANGGTGAATLGNGAYVKSSTGTFPLVPQNGIPAIDITGTLTNTQLANNQTTINGVARVLGASTTITAENAFAQNPIVTTPATMNGGVLVGANFAIAPKAVITANSTVIATDGIREINSNSTVTVSITTGLQIGSIIELPLNQASTGSVIINSLGTETFNSNTTYTLGANSQGATIRLVKLTATNFKINCQF
jgi:carbonic anhydrase/acetyltransferase-like protein (isoleucine patch superfamily)